MDGTKRRDATAPGMEPEVCPVCCRYWGDLPDDHSALLDHLAALRGRERWVCQNTVSPAEYAALDAQRPLGPPPRR